jgi:hypothetical protein
MAFDRPPRSRTGVLDVSFDGIDLRLRIEGLEHLVGGLAARQTRRPA